MTLEKQRLVFPLVRVFKGVNFDDLREGQRRDPTPKVEAPRVPALRMSRSLTN